MLKNKTILLVFSIFLLTTYKSSAMEELKIGAASAGSLLIGSYSWARANHWVNSRNNGAPFNNKSFLAAHWSKICIPTLGLIASMRLGSYPTLECTDLYKPLLVALAGIGLTGFAGAVYGSTKKLKQTNPLNHKAEKDYNILMSGLDAMNCATALATLVVLPGYMLWKRAHLS